jgi:hypothetical protein
MIELVSDCLANMHGMIINDKVGNINLAVTYCPLTGTGKRLAYTRVYIAL